MLTALILALACAGVRALLAAAFPLRDLPRSNDDMIFY
jgi:hypothetical protein